MIKLKDNIRTYRIKDIGCIVVLLFVFMVTGMYTRAANDPSTTLGILYTLTADTEVKELPDENAVSVGILKAGTNVIVESENGTWSKVIYQDLEGYIMNNVQEEYAAPKELTVEMNNVAEEEQRYVEETRLLIKERRASIIWGTMIAVLIIAIFALGVVSAVYNTKAEEAPKKDRLSKVKGEKLADLQDMADEILIEDLDAEESTETL